VEAGSFCAGAETFTLIYKIRDLGETADFHSQRGIWRDWGNAKSKPVWSFYERFHWVGLSDTFFFPL
jgi:hypothetical protein